MNSCLRGLLAATLVAVSISRPDAIAGQEFLGSFPLTPGGVGPLKIGSSFGEAHKLLPSLREKDRGQDVPTSPCTEVDLLLGNTQIGFLFIQGKVERIDVLSEGISTQEGIHVGSTAADVERAYRGKVEAFPHEYFFLKNRAVSANQTWIVYSANHRPALILDGYDDVVTGMHVGSDQYYWRTSDELDPLGIPDCAGITG
jgi:hypothetical protein